MDVNKLLIGWSVWLAKDDASEALEVLRRNVERGLPCAGRGNSHKAQKTSLIRYYSIVRGGASERETGSVPFLFLRPPHQTGALRLPG